MNASVLYDTMMDLFGGAGQHVGGPQQRKGESPSYDAFGRPEVEDDLAS